MEAEEHMRSLDDLKTVALRPGFIHSTSERIWSMPLKHIVNVNHVVMGGFLNVISNNQVHKFLSNFNTDTAIALDDVVNAAIFCAFSEKLDDNKWLYNQQIEETSKNFQDSNCMVE